MTRPEWFRVLWAPWRMTYVKSAAEGKAGGSCIFCDALSMDEREALVLVKAERAYVILNKYPYNTGHLMVVPKRHVPSLEDLTTEEMVEISLLLKASMKALRRVYNPQGFNVGVNIGRAAGAGIESHVHVHVVPRWSGDANFMLTTGGVKVIPQDLYATYDALKPVMIEEAKRVGLEV
ncbi:HIT family protein [Stetteria hydrogenophila]